MMPEKNKNRIEFGDWQTPIELTRQVVGLLKNNAIQPGSIIEPTCGKGLFLVAAVESFPGVNIIGYDINEEYIKEAISLVHSSNCQIRTGNFFDLPWESIISSLPEPLLIIGNPPWVTNANLGVIGSDNLPDKANFKGLSGLDAITGKSNFDVSEYMIMRLLNALKNHKFTLAMLVKASVSRRILEFSSHHALNVSGKTYSIDAMKHFEASVEAVLLVISSGAENDRKISLWPVFDKFNSTAPIYEMGVIDGQLIKDAPSYLNTRMLEGRSDPEWRSGIKHDCSGIMEFHIDGGRKINGNGEEIEIEDTFIFPLAKGSDLANSREVTNRGMLVTQCFIGEDTSKIARLAPKTWEYLSKRANTLGARKSSIYKNQPPFSIFGVGDYSFAPYKVAICGLYKKLSFSLLRSTNDKPMMVDDTCYFLPYYSLEEAILALNALSSPKAIEFYDARIFWDAKRPITKAVLEALNLDILINEMGNIKEPKKQLKPQQQSLIY